MGTQYAAQALSPATALDGSLNDSATTVSVLDASKLPTAPNLATIGTGEDAEVILYTGKSDNDLTGVTRQFEGTAKAWDSGTPVARLLTAYDLNNLPTALKETANTWSKAQVGATVALTDATNISVDASAGNSFRVLLEGSRTLDNPTNAVGGWTFQIVIKQDGDGSRTLAYGDKYAFEGGDAPTLSTAEGAIDILSGVYNATEDKFFCALTKAWAVPA